MALRINPLEKIIKTNEDLERLKAQLSFKGKKIVFTNGCFDILHRGHVEYLYKASLLGDVLFLGLNSDASVKRLKGKNRPLQDEIARMTILASLYFVDAIMVFDEDTPFELIKKVQPDFLVKGKDYKAEDIVGYDVVTQKGGKVVTIDLVEGYSTTNLIEKINPNQ